ncbi:hypothetical protein B0T13DRAFT_143049 [Neurospora crassa]|nr:hypothetical protein B0T13DRAFT_143049 [Neurospora crassa]
MLVIVIEGAAVTYRVHKAGQKNIAWLELLQMRGAVRNRIPRIVQMRVLLQSPSSNCLSMRCVSVKTPAPFVPMDFNTTDVVPISSNQPLRQLDCLPIPSLWRHTRCAGMSCIYLIQVTQLGAQIRGKSSWQCAVSTVSPSDAPIPRPVLILKPNECYGQVSYEQELPGRSWKSRRKLAGLFPIILQPSHHGTTIPIVSGSSCRCLLVCSEIGKVPVPPTIESGLCPVSQTTLRDGKRSVFGG